MRLGGQIERRPGRQRRDQSTRRQKDWYLLLPLGGFEPQRPGGAALVSAMAAIARNDGADRRLHAPKLSIDFPTPCRFCGVKRWRSDASDGRSAGVSGTNLAWIYDGNSDASRKDRQAG
jgi:hypothetical protein